MTEVLVLGAGMVGVSSALALQEKGFDVVLVDRTEPGLQASYGNAGMIQVEASEPYALPQDMPSLLSHALEISNDVVWKVSGILQMWKGLWLYNRYSSDASHQSISKTYSYLTSRSTQDHGPLIQAAKAEDLITKTGLFMLYRENASFDKALKKASLIESRYGTRFRSLDGASYQAEEPALKQTPAGGIHWLDSWSCSDPGALTQAYAKLFVERGGQLIKGDAQTLQATPHGWSVMDKESNKVEAKQVVLCLGHHTPALLKTFGYDIPMVYKRGYHGHYNCHNGPKIPFLDVDNGVLAAPMRKGLRLTTGAALVDIDTPSDPRQLKRGEAAIREMLELGKRVEEPQWFGTRPCLPDMLPLVGPAPKHKGLWFHFGHGHQGFTLGPTTAEFLVQHMLGTPADVAIPLLPSERTWIK